MLSRRAVLKGAAGASLIAVSANAWLHSAPAAELKSMTADAKPISAGERRARAKSLDDPI